MNDAFRIEVDWLEGMAGEQIERSTYAQVVMLVDDQPVTELDDLFARTVRSGLRASANHLALWLASNWWRLRWEPESGTDDTDWKLSHSVAAVGGGFAWPDLTFASDGKHVHVRSIAGAPKPTSPVRYLVDADRNIDVRAFEAGTDDFVQRVLARLSGIGIDGTELSQIWDELSKERRDPALSELRKLEALLGFDPGEAPESIMSRMREAQQRVGSEAGNEVAAAKKSDAPKTIETLIDGAAQAQTSITVPAVSDIVERSKSAACEGALPWQRAEVAASVARGAWHLGAGRVANHQLDNIFGAPARWVEQPTQSRIPLGAGFRVNGADSAVQLLGRSPIPANRRFELMRVVADHCFAPSADRLLPLTTARTDRQKFQRAFAQEILCPFAELSERFSNRKPDDDEIDATAREYEVSSLLIRTILVNKGLLDHGTLDP